MLFAAFLSWMGSILSWLAGMTALPVPPAFLGEGSAQLSMIVGQAAALCRFVDFSLWPQAILVVVNVYVVSLLIRILRVAFGFFVG